MRKSNDFVRPLSQTMGSIRELSAEETSLVSGADGEQADQQRPTDTLCWDMIGEYRVIDD